MFILASLFVLRPLSCLDQSNDVIVHFRNSRPRIADPAPGSGFCLVGHSSNAEPSHQPLPAEPLLLPRFERYRSTEWSYDSDKAEASQLLR